MHRLTSSFILGYHGCDQEVGERLLDGDLFKKSENDYDWLGPGVYFWESNPARALEFAQEKAKRDGSIRKPYVVGAVIDLGNCLDLTTKDSLEMLKIAYDNLAGTSSLDKSPLPKNTDDQFRRNLDCAVIQRLHTIIEESNNDSDKTDRDKLSLVDTVKGVFTEPPQLFPGSGFMAKTHIQIAVCNFDCIKGVFRVPYPREKSSI